MKKKIFLIIIGIFVILFLMIFIKNNYKNFKFGNNESNKSVKEVEDYILNINSYTAMLDVTIESNKNSNKYILKQELGKNNFEKQTVIKPENIEGTELIYNNGNLELKNTQLNITKMYNNYPYLADNILWLNSFVEHYKSDKEHSKIYEENEFVVMQIDKISNNIGRAKLYIEKGTGRPKKMIIQDNNKKSTIYILYTEININK